MKIFIFLTVGLLCLQGLRATGQPSLLVDAGPDTAYCGTEYIRLGGQVPASGGTPPYTYYWSLTNWGNVGNLDSLTVPHPRVIGSGYLADSLEYVLHVTDANGLTGSDEVNVSFSRFYSSARFPYTYIIAKGDSIFLSGGIFVYGNFPVVGYSWRPATGLSDATSESFWAKPDTTTSYSVEITDSKGCRSGYEETYIVIVSPPVGIEEAGQGKVNGTVYPNPAADIVYISGIKDIKEALLCDVAGKVIYRGRSKEISLQQWKAGMYILTVTDAADRTERFKVVKQ